MASWHMDKNLACSICIFFSKEKAALHGRLCSGRGARRRGRWWAKKSLGSKWLPSLHWASGAVQVLARGGFCLPFMAVSRLVDSSAAPHPQTAQMHSRKRNFTAGPWGTVGFVRGTVVLGWTPPNKANWQSGWKSAWPICAGSRPAGKLDMKLAPQWEHVLACQESPRAVQVCRHHKQ